MGKSLLICPVCESKGKKQVLGEIDKDGNLVVMRFKGQGEHAVTQVKAKEMEVTCGICNEVVFYRRSK